MHLEKNPIIICAIDTNNVQIAKDIIQELHGVIPIFKIGLEYFTMNGMFSAAIHNQLQPSFFLDLKFHDIPNTVYGAISGLRKFEGVSMTTVHAAGGTKMMEAAVEAAEGKFDILAVTLLTSIADQNATDIVLERTADALNAGVAGIVCSPQEVKAVRKEFGDDFKIVVPGIRLFGYNNDDQKRTGTPKQTMEDGATHLVIGRPITQADNPRNATIEIINSFN